MLDATPPAGAWFDGCDRLGRQLVRAFERLDHDLRTSPRQRALYLGLLAEVTALRVRALALDTPRVEPLDEDAKKQSRTDLGVACYDLLHEAIDAYERPQCGGPD